VSTREDQQRILAEIERDLRRGNRMMIAGLSLLRARDVLRRKGVGVLLGVEAVLVIAALTAALAGWQRLLHPAVQAAVVLPVVALYLWVRLGRSGRNKPGAPWSPWRL
jgi:hypothetical protein